MSKGSNTPGPRLSLIYDHTSRLLNTAEEQQSLLYSEQNITGLSEDILLEWTRDQPKFGFDFGNGTETGDISSLVMDYREAWFRTTFGYGRN